ncbi:centrosomal protein CEP57L1 isoform X6 [Cricetulus griseus]|uniref:Centrosomal protein 57kDa-like protein 1 n=1 Tax=Cricetulus griseus TaxID=10029 RepID=A0A9J7FFX9_CRIGR|nr:centrosomal protein CEP57L1 isoform X6 [Cricetulus griseus]XP_027258026.1 centrosomal protein CEP57L1 isoform X6 [Cricetulus griseus]
MLPTPCVCDRNYNPHMPPQLLSQPANQRLWRPGLTGNVHLNIYSSLVHMWTMNPELSHNVIGSYLNPPERMYFPSFIQNEASQNGYPVDSEVIPPKMFNSPNNQDISIQLSSAQSRCTLLEKQLEYTKRMVLNVEREKAMILEQQAQLQREKEQDQMKLHAKLEKLDVLEKECFRLTTTQQTAEDKIKYLEEKLKEEEHHRKLFQDKACELQTGLEISKILMSTVSHSKLCKEKKKPLKKTKCLKRDPPQQMDPKFRALSLQGGKCLYKSLGTTSQGKAGPPNSEEPISICDNLSELLMAMQEELDQMTVEHKELLKEMMQPGRYSDDIEHELEQLAKKIESKGDQISKLKKHQDSVRKLQQKVQNSRINESSCVLQEHDNPKGPKNIKTSSRKGLNETNPLQKNSSFRPVQVHNLQVKLRRDDIKWEQ